MEISAVVSKDELAALLRQATPFRIDFDTSGRRWVHFGRPHAVELVPGAGLRLRGAARLSWELAGLLVPVTLRAWQILLAPSISLRGGQHVLAFDPILEELDTHLAPAFLDARLRDLINEALRKQQGRLVWRFSRTLERSLSLPSRVSPGGTFELRTTKGVVAVTAAEMRLTVTLEASVSRATAGTSPPQDARPPPPSV